MSAPKDTIAASDGAGVVLKAGSDVTSLQPGDRVVAHMCPEAYPDSSPITLGEDNLPTMGHIIAGLGQSLNGTLTTHGVFTETCLVKFGGKMSFAEAATLSCSGITAWNSLFGLKGKEVKKSDWVLVQGSGGVSVNALQFAHAVGANVVATTSNEEKGKRLKELGASHIINYRTTPDWAVHSKALTPDGRGFDIIVDVGGNATLSQSLQAVRTDGVIQVAGMVGWQADSVPLLGLMGTNAVARGVLLGTRRMMREMVSFVEGKGVRMAVDEEEFGFEGAKEALAKVEAQKHFAKVIVNIP